MKSELESFIAKVPGFEQMSLREQVACFAFFLTEVAGEKSIRPQRIRECFEQARLSPPRNISDVMGKSGYFVSTAAGMQLQRFKQQQILEILGRGDGSQAEAAVASTRDKTRPNPGATSAPVAESVPGLSRNVMVVYGRNQQLRDSMFGFLRALGLNPIEWSEAVKATGKGSPYVGEILDAAFGMAQAIVVLLTPDEEVQLRGELCANEDEFLREHGFQPRANVLIEAGMALGRAEDRTILVQVGEVRAASDLEGRHIVRLDDSAEKRNDLAQRLKTAGCEPDTSRQDWYRTGKFKVTAKARGRTK